MNPGALEFTAPAWFWLLPVLAIAALAACARGGARSGDALVAGAGDAGLRLLHPLLALVPAAPVASRRALAAHAVTWLSLGLLVVALAGPVRLGRALPEPPREHDVVFIVDTSVSMVLRDFVLNGERVDRMNVVKGLLDEFIRTLRGERVSIIVFADTAYTLVPLTADRDLARRMLTRLDVGMAGRFNAVGDAIALAVRDAAGEDPRRRVLVLLTDADQPTGTIAPQTAATLAAQADLPLYTVGIGATTYAAEEQRSTGLIYHPVDAQLLQELAARTGARSFLAGDTAALRAAIDAIARPEVAAASPRFERRPLYVFPLAAGLALLSIGQWLQLRERRRA